jgi:peptidoglycan/LPS O-acetylase OafA/YrhL
VDKRSYRPDIDGLRAIAVLAVLFYHAELKPFSGGYIGVDIFFVISGFLITGLIVKDIRSNQFSLVTFYERRIRRIFPAYFTVAVVVGLVGAWLYDANTFKALAESLIASTLSLANILFYSQAGYFDGPSHLKPLLHTWSLSVEEQFYLFLPLILFLIFKYARRWLTPILIALLLVSLTGSVFVMQTNSDAAFYLAHLRAWELLIGGLIALRPMRLKSWLQEFLAMLGLVVILVCMVLYSENTRFPGLAALAPVLGTALIINAGVSGKPLVGKILSSPIMVFIGKISYSLYLWHWPLLLFGKYIAITGMTLSAYLVWGVLTFALSILSWRFVETPFRSKQLLPQSRMFLVTGGIAAFILAAAVLVILFEGFPARFDKDSWKSAAAWNADDEKWIRCLEYIFGHEDGPIDSDVCKIGVPSAEPTVLLWGDSHGMALASGLDQSARHSGSTIQMMIRNACPPLVGIGRQDRMPECYDHNNEVFNYIKTHPQIKTVILASRWSLNALGTRYKNEEGVDVVLMDMTTAETGQPNTAIFETGLVRTIEELTKLDRQVVLISPIPEVGYDVPSSFFVANRTGREVNAIIAPTREEFLIRNRFILDLLNRLKKDYENIQLVDVTDVFCDQLRCNVTHGNEPLYKDDHHLSTAGSLMLAPALDAIFK